MKAREKLYLIDVSSYFYRAFFALPPLTTASGLPTNAIYGFTTMVQRLLKEHHPDYLAAVLDCPEPTFRHSAYQDYKANRPDMPENLSVQIPHMKDVIAAFRIPAVEKPGYEADDVIGTLARQAAADGVAVVIVSGDKDLCQLVSEQITLLDTMKNKVIDPHAVKATYGVAPEALIDVFALTGDKVDNVPGVPGIGEKTAAALISSYGSLDGVYEQINEITKKKLKELLCQYKEQAYLSRTLVTIDCAVPLEVHWRDLRVQPPDEDALRRLFKKFEFTTLLKNLPAERAHATRYQVVTELRALQDLIATLRASGSFAIDLETTSEDPMRAAIVGIACAVREHEAWYIPVGHVGLAEQLDREFVLAQFKELLEDEQVGKIGHNIKYEYVLFNRHGITLRGIVCDTMIASYVLNPSKYRHNLDDVALDYLDYRMTSFKDVAGTGKKAVTFDRVPLATATAYACEDADITLRLSGLLLPRLRETDQEELFYHIEMPLVPVLAAMEMTGVKVDTELLRELSRELSTTLRQIETRIYELAGMRFNINSPKQLGEVLFEKLKLPVGKKTKTGYSTDIDTLQELAAHHPLPKEILTYRSLAKLISTYIEAMPNLVHPQTGRIHTSYNQTVTATGRLSSSEPNLQNIPIRTDEGIRIREAFVTDPGWRIVSADYSQIELRILAHLSGDTALIEAFRTDEDIHTRTASEIWGVPPAQVDSRMRREAKVINFGIIYGMSAYGLSKELGIEASVAQEYIDHYFLRHSGVRAYLDAVIDQARQLGYVTTLMNRRRYLPEIKATNANVRKFAERTAINTPIQGTAADLIKIAMIRVAAAIEHHKMQSRMILQVHDELVFEAPEGEVLHLERLVRKEMEEVISLKVPLKVEIHSGKNWREAH